MNMTGGNTSYQLKYRDRCPHIPTAGKLVPAGDRAKSCLQEVARPSTPPVVRKFRNSIQPEPGAIRVHSGKANDPDVASTLVHGIKTKSSLTGWMCGRLLTLQKQLRRWRGNLRRDTRLMFVATMPILLVSGLIGNMTGVTAVKTAGLVSSHLILMMAVILAKLSAGLARHRSFTIQRLFGRDLGTGKRWRHKFTKRTRRVGETIHSTEPGQYVRGRDRQRSLVNTVRHHLKKVNFHNFPSLLQAFRHYDKKGKGMIDKEDLRAVCRQFQLDVSGPVLDDLMDYCDTDKDGLINFLEFANFLNWKDKMLINTQEQDIITNECQTSVAPANRERKPLSESEQLPASQALIKPEDLEPVEQGSSKKTLRTLRRHKADPDHFITSSSFIGAISDRSLTSNSRTYGIPSVRSDLPAPPIKRVSDTTNYGDTSTAAKLLHPSVHALQGVHEEHLLCPRTKSEIAEIFRNVGVNISEETFEEAWKLASMKQPDGKVCVEVFCNVLKEIKAM
ncbi:EF-hand domain-containing family member B isoform X2 [Seriola dumerili]|uniref:EF-hand domain-containing family member B isoform X2 n=1 Tax=Seriola dumerili TaxID=41447 RepID=UPI000BBEC32D|nr:EF-hand domain-containing family member B isoform X2 [Seriola dumerili]